MHPSPRSRRPPPTRSHRRLLGLVGLVASTACTAGVGLPSVPSPERIPALEAEVADRDTDPAPRVLLGAAYRADGRPAEALPLLERATELGSADPSVHFFLGLTYEDLDRPTEAIASYGAFLEGLPPGEARDRVEARVEALRRDELRRAAREALSREDSIRRGAPPDPANVAVLPFRFESTDESLRPLTRALSQMLMTDLSLSPRIRVLERLRVQALLDEVERSRLDWFDPATAARGGYLLGAGRVVRGRLGGTGQEVEVAAAVVDAAPGSRELPTVERTEGLDRLFEVQTQLALELFEVMGVALTPAEREQVTRRPTENLQALLAYGRGLEAADAGLMQEAAEWFERAAALDGGFSEARTELRRAAAAAVVEGTETGEFATVVAEAVVEIPDVDLSDVLDRSVIRDPAQEALGGEGLGELGGLRVVFPRPGGGS